jgi:hypothetical protein
MKHFVLFAACSVLFLFSGCAVKNNHLAPEDFADCLKKNGINVEAVRPESPSIFKATSACAIKVDGEDILVFKYDISTKVQKERLERIAQTRKVYAVGFPFYAYVHGSFAFIKLDKCKQKHAVIKAIKSFQ